MSVKPNFRAAVLSPLSMTGVFFGSILFALSMTPSMVPRGPELQGVLGGLLMSLGYLIWYCIRALARFLGIGENLVPNRMVQWLLGLGSAITLSAALWTGTDWQNSIRLAWGLPPVDTTNSLKVILFALSVFLLLLVLGRLFQLVALRWRLRTSRFLPPRVSQALGLIVAVSLFWVIINGVMFKFALRVIDNSSRVADMLIAPELTPPSRSTTSGGPASLVAWEQLGRWGRQYISSEPTAAEIAEFWGMPAEDPIRVYVGLAAAGSAEDRARLAFEDLKRLGGFDRKVLVVAMPTGSGWLDPAGMVPLEYMTRGDVATVAVQYSYLSSPMSVLVDATHGLDEAQRLFDLIYRHWKTLPKTDRPQLYLHGLSLGAFLSQQTVPLLDLFADPIDGAMWVGSPFLSGFWRMVRDRRNAGSPAWRPKFGNGSLIRTMNQDGGLDRFDADWGPMRFVLLQYGSDPIVFFSYSLAWKRPGWLSGDRAPDLSAEMRWIPVVTMLQVAVDMGIALGTVGYGHDISTRHYIQAWSEALSPGDWPVDIEARLLAHLSHLDLR